MGGGGEHLQGCIPVHLHVLTCRIGIDGPELSRVMFNRKNKRIHL